MSGHAGSIVALRTALVLRGTEGPLSSQTTTVIRRGCARENRGPGALRRARNRAALRAARWLMRRGGGDELALPGGGRAVRTTTEQYIERLEEQLLK